MTAKIEITSQVVAQGSYGIRKIDSRGRDIGNVIKVWHLAVNGDHVGSYATRADARDDADIYRS